MNPVIVTGNAQGNVVNLSVNNPEYGYVRLEQIAFEISPTGWLQSKNRSTLLKGKVETLTKFGFTKGQTLPGKIVIKEQLTPFSEIGGERDIKYAGNTGVPCLLDGQPIYRQSFYTTNVDEQDVLIQHNNSQQIKDAQKAEKILNSLNPETI
jgi:hypothetical protein